jgi:hypothetical protein
VRVAAGLGRCTIAKPSSSLDESVSNPRTAEGCEGFGLYTSVEEVDAAEVHRVAVAFAESARLRVGALSAWTASSCQILDAVSDAGMGVAGRSTSISCGRSLEASVVGRTPD